MVLKTTEVQDFGTRGALHQYETVEYSIPVVSDIKIHKDKSITLFEKGELSRELSQANSNHSSIEANLASQGLGTKYLGFFFSRSLKTREKYISFAQFVYFLREVSLLFNF